MRGDSSRPAGVGGPPGTRTHVDACEFGIEVDGQSTVPPKLWRKVDPGIDGIVSRRVTGSSGARLKSSPVGADHSIGSVASV